MSRDEIMSSLGAENWEMVVESFSKLSAKEIEAEFDTVWPYEPEGENTRLAQAICAELK